MKLKIAIINPPIRLTDKPRHIPHGLAILANIIRKKLGTTPVFIDINAYRYSDGQVDSMLRSIDFDVVLIGGLIPVYKSIIAYAGMIKAIKPEAVIIAGGSAAMSAPETLLLNSRVDAVCTGEGEKAIVDLLRGLQGHKLEDLAGIKGFCFRAGEGVIDTGKPDLLDDLDHDSDMPAYDLLPMDIYLSNPIIGFGRDVDFISSRGCPFECTFCYQPWGRRFRGHSIDFIIDAIRYLRREYNIDFVSFQDDEFMAKKNRVHEFCEKIRQDIPGLLWSCTGRANLVDEKTTGQMRESGCVSISYGFESGSPRILKAMKKHVTIEQMELATRISRRFGMMLPVSFIIGMPGEDAGSCAETVEFCVRNNLPLKSMMFATPYPGTELFEFALASGRIKQEAIHDFILKLGDARDFTINLTDSFTDKELMDKRDEMIRNVCSGISPVSAEVSFMKIKRLFGSLADNYIKDEMLVKHRAEHGGIDIF